VKGASALVYAAQIAHGHYMTHLHDSFRESQDRIVVAVPIFDLCIENTSVHETTHSRTRSTYLFVGSEVGPVNQSELTDKFDY